MEVPILNRSNLLNPKLTMLFFAVLVDKLGGETTITQKDIDKVAYNSLYENAKEDGSVTLKVVRKSSHS